MDKKVIISQRAWHYAPNAAGKVGDFICGNHKGWSFVNIGTNDPHVIRDEHIYRSCDAAIHEIEREQFVEFHKDNLFVWMKIASNNPCYTEKVRAEIETTVSRYILNLDSEDAPPFELADQSPIRCETYESPTELLKMILKTDGAVSKEEILEKSEEELKNSAFRDFDFKKAEDESEEEAKLFYPDPLLDYTKRHNAIQEEINEVPEPANDGLTKEQREDLLKQCDDIIENGPKRLDETIKKGEETIEKMLYSSIVSQYCDKLNKFLDELKEKLEEVSANKEEAKNNNPYFGYGVIPGECGMREPLVQDCLACDKVTCCYKLYAYN